MMRSVQFRSHFMTAWALLGFCFFSPARASDSIAPAGIRPQDSPMMEAAWMLHRADSLLEIDRPVAALSMYRGASERSFDPCQRSRAHVGIARIYAGSQNPELATAALQNAHTGFLACDSDVRKEQVIRAADLWLALYQESRAIELIQYELHLEPNDLQLMAKLADLYFTAGLWDQARTQYTLCLNHIEASNPSMKATWLSAIIQTEGIEGKSASDSVVAAFAEVAEIIPRAEAQSHREQIQLTFALEGQHAQALIWAHECVTHADPTNPEALAVAHLRVGNSAVQSHRPLDALIGFHEALKAARLTDNRELVAEILRQKGLFEHERGNSSEALEAFLELDRINAELLALAYPTVASNRETRQFNEQVMPALDPFDQAVFDIQAQRSSPYRSSGWPWIAGLLGIGMLAYARTQRQLKSALHKERRRIIRLRSLVPTDRLPSNMQTVTAESTESSFGDSSLMPNGEWVVTRDSDPRSQCIRTFLAELDEDLKSRISAEINEEVEFSIGPEVRVAIRNLLRGVVEISAQESPITLEVAPKGRTLWQLTLNSRHTGASKALEGLFYGKDALASSRWNELHAQLRKLAGKINIERLSPIEERLTVTLPYL